MANKQLVRPKTCSTCPFRGGFHLNYNRRLDIVESLTRRDETFHCHSEVNYDENESNTYGAAQCAGATTVLLREGHYNQAMRWHARFGGGKLEEDPEVPFTTLQDWIHEPEFSQGAPPPEEEGYTCEVVWGRDCECPAGWSAGGGMADNHNRLEHPVNFCAYCSGAMCDACRSEHNEDGLMTCLMCAEDLEEEN